jgi:hypothetical protein
MKSEEDIDFTERKAPDYGIHKPQPSDSKLKELGALVNEAKDTFTLSKTFEKRSEQEAKRYKDLTENRIPSLMQEVGLKELTTEQGFKVKLEPYVFGTVPSPSGIASEKDPVKRAALIARRDAGLAWLRANGHADMIRHSFEVEFDPDQTEQADEFRSLLGNIPFVEGCTVHHKTLSSLLQRLQSQGKTYPEEAFGACPRTVARFSGSK